MKMSGRASEGAVKRQREEGEDHGSNHNNNGFRVALNSNGHKAGWLVADALGFRMEQFVSLSDQVSPW